MCEGERLRRRPPATASSCHEDGPPAGPRFHSPVVRTAGALLTESPLFPHLGRPGYAGGFRNALLDLHGWTFVLPWAIDVALMSRVTKNRRANEGLGLAG